MTSSPFTPADSFAFCPRCGKPELEFVTGRSCRCQACGFRYFFNCAAAAGAFVRHQGTLILTVRAKDPQRGMLDLPGGFVEFDETIEEGLRREIFEELHLETSNFRYLTSAPNDYPYAGVLYKVTDLFFVCDAGDLSTVQLQDEIADIRLIAPKDLDPASLAFPSSRRALHALLESTDIYA